MTEPLYKNLPVWQQNHIKCGIDDNLFQNKKVLEVGGYTKYEITQSLNVKSWYCIDPLYRGVYIHSDAFKVFQASILDFDVNEKFDTIIATNSFEHVNGLAAGIEHMYSLLNDGGKVSALLGPIWSCYKGHHVWYTQENGEIINFNNIKLDDWAHLLYSQEEIKEQLLKNYDEKSASDISSWIFETDFLNKMFYDDYKKLIESSKFNILEFRDWHKSKIPSSKIQKILEEKYNRKNFSTVSIKMLLEK